MTIITGPISLSISYGDFDAPNGTVISVIDVSLSTAGAQVDDIKITPGTPSATFTVANPGDYAVTAQALDGGGQPVGPSASCSFSVSAANTVVQIPIAIAPTTA